MSGEGGCIEFEKQGEPFANVSVVHRRRRDRGLTEECSANGNDTMTRTTGETCTGRTDVVRHIYSGGLTSRASRSGGATPTSYQTLKL